MRSFVPSVQVVAHRGASGHAPENTLAAFRLAHDHGADWFELDAALTRDGHVVVIHDDTLQRTTNGQGPVVARTLAELKALDAGAWKCNSFRGEPLPTLTEALEFSRGRLGVYVELKAPLPAPSVRAPFLHATPAQLPRLLDLYPGPDVDLARASLEAIRAADVPGRVVVQSFSPITCLAVRTLAPDLRVELLAEGDDPDDDELLLWATRHGFAGINPEHVRLSPERIARWHAAGLTVTTWTVNDPHDMRRLAAWGVDRLITDHPLLARQTLAALADAPLAGAPLAG